MLVGLFGHFSFPFYFRAAAPVQSASWRTARKKCSKSPESTWRENSC